jgi:hypothetical protein
LNWLLYHYTFLQPLKAVGAYDYAPIILLAIHVEYRNAFLQVKGRNHTPLPLSAVV